MTNLTNLDIFTRALERFTPERFCQGTYAQDADGVELYYGNLHDGGAAKVCVVGACFAVEPDPDRWHAALNKAARDAGYAHAAHANDTGGYEVARRVLVRAIEQASKG
jgi:hypothetical protein